MLQKYSEKLFFGLIWKYKINTYLSFYNFFPEWLVLQEFQKMQANGEF